MTILHSPGGIARPATSSLQDAAARLAEQVECHAGYLAQLEEYTNKAERELEDERREAGRLRARIEELESGSRARHLEELLREAVGEDDHIVLHQRNADHPLWRARVALGLDGRSGHRDISAGGV